MIPLSKQEIQRMSANQELMKLTEEDLEEKIDRSSSNQSRLSVSITRFLLKVPIINKIKFEIVGRTFLRLIIVLVTSTTLLELERNL